ncbi:hypothetical protein KUTeg_013881, partial [Tegillarca granosa]
MALKHVAVIGAGVSGLTATKECLAQGIDVTCYEMHDDIGGTWYYTEHLRPDEGATIYDFLITNTSREMMRYSDFNFPPHAAVFPRHKEVHDYLIAYANHFDVTKHVKLNTKVIDIQKSENHLQNGKWKVVTQQKDETKKEITEFDGVIVCNGFHKIPSIPDIDGFSNFQGQWSHSKTFKSGKHFARKRVLVIATGPLFPTAELQARYAAMVFAGKKKLPSKDVMTTDIKRWQDIHEAFFGKGKYW